MIEGFKCMVPGHEVREHLQKRAAYHKGKSEWYEQEKEKLADAPTGQMSNDPVQAMKDAGKRHLGKSRIFTFLAAHIPADETFVLSTRELQSLEFIDDCFVMY